MAKISDVERNNLSIRVRKIAKSVTSNPTTDSKAHAGLALSILALLSGDLDLSLSQQLLKLLKDLER